MNGGVINVARGVSSLASQMLSPQKRLEPLSDSIKSVSVITGYVKKLGESKKQQTADQWEDDFELPSTAELNKKFEQKKVPSNNDDIFHEIDNTWGNNTQVDNKFASKKYQVPTTAIVQRLGDSSKKRAHESENWDDLEIPDTGLRLRSNLTNSSVDSSFSVSDFQMKENSKPPVAKVSKKPSQRTKVLSKKLNIDTETETDDLEDGIEIPANISLELPNHRNLSSTNFYGTWTPKPKVTHPPSSSASSMKSESENENFDDIMFPENPQELKLAIPQEEDEDWTRDVLIPEGIDLSALSKKNKKPSLKQSKIGERRASSRDSRPSSLFSGPMLISTEFYGDGTELDSIEDLKLSYESKKSLPKQDKKRRKPILIQNKTSNQVRRVVQKMQYNPQTFKWEGNYEVLKNFENPGPKLFTPANYSVPQVVEGMRFNQLTGSWKGEKDDNEFDEFKDIPDLIVEEKKQNTKSFIIDDSLKQIFLSCEKSHNEFFSKWLDKNGQLLVDNSIEDDYKYLVKISVGMGNGS